jgi:hypothetical protein
MNNQLLEAPDFEYSLSYFNVKFEEILGKINICYGLMITSKVVLPNNENKIRNELVNNYLNNNNTRNRIAVKNYYFQSEAPNQNDTGRFDIKIISQQTTFTDTNAFYAIECKRLDGKSKLNKKYISDGIKRFTNEQKYPFYDNTAGMIGFIVSKMDIHKNVDCINQLLQNSFTEINTEKELTKRQITPDFEYSYYSNHKVDATTKTLYHLMFDFSDNIKSA